MKKNKTSHYKMALLAVASAALLAPVVHGATVTTQLGDVILGFHATGAPGATSDLEVNLGPITQFYSVPAGQTIQLSGLSTADLVATYGATWYLRTDLYWGAVATAGRTAAFGSFPLATLWATAPDCQGVFNRGGVNSQKSGSANIEGLLASGGPGALNGATSTANSTNSAVCDGTLADSWAKLDAKTGGTSFGYFNPTVDNVEGTNVVASQLFELQPGTGAGTYLGDLIVKDSGLYFRGGGAVAAVCTTLTVPADGTCHATVTAAQVGANSTGYCLGQDSFGSTNAVTLPVGSTNLTFSVTDGYGSNSTCTATVNVTAAAPTVASASNISTNLASGCSAVVTYTAPAGSGCATPIGVVCSPASPATLAVGVHTVTCIGTDALSQTGTNSFTVTVTSSAVPTLSSTADVTNNPATCSATAVTYTLPTASGCNTPGTVVCTPASGSTFQLGTTAVSCSVTDALNRVGTSSFNVVVKSTAAPTLSSTANITNAAASGQCSAVVTYATPTASGCNTPGTVNCTPASGTTFNVGTTTVSCSVTDAASRTGTSSFTVTVTSGNPTVVGTPSNITTSVPSASVTSVVVTYTTPTGNGCATPINVVCSPASGASFSIGSTNVICTATDASSRTGTSSFTVTVGGQGVNGIKGIVSGITTNTDPKMNNARINSLLTSLTLAGNDLNKYKTNAHTHVITTNVTAACAQLNAELIKAKVYFQLHLLSTNTYSALTNSVVAEQKAIGCK